MMMEVEGFINKPSVVPSAYKQSKIIGDKRPSSKILVFVGK